jgi:hypothetical protein
LSVNTIESRHLTDGLKNRHLTLSQWLDVYSQFRVKSSFCTKIEFPFFIPIYTDAWSYPGIQLKSGVHWYDFVCSLKSRFVRITKNSKAKNESKSYLYGVSDNENNVIYVRLKRKRHDAWVNANYLTKKSIVAVCDNDFSKKQWWADVFNFDVDVDIKYDGFVYQFSDNELKDAYSPKIPIWLYLNIEILNKIVEYAFKYLNDIHDGKIVLFNYYEDKALVLDYSTRFSEQYLKRIKHKIIERGKFLNKFNNLGYKSTFITLTVRISDYNSLQLLMNTLTKMFNKFITHLRHYVDFLDYIRFFEIGHKNNVVHIHLLLINKLGFINADIVRQCWSIRDTLIGGVHLKFFNNVLGGVKYTLKYITKLIQYDYDANNEKKKLELGFKLLSLLWATNKRLYSTSSKFTKIMLELIRLTQKIYIYNTFDSRLIKRWWGFIVIDPSIPDYTNKYTVLSPPNIESHDWVYIGSCSFAWLPLPAGMYELKFVAHYLYVDGYADYVCW